MNNVKLRTRQRYSIPTDVLDDLLTRFLLFVPESAKQNLTRICFQIELAHWFYLDFYVEKDKRLQSCNMTEFAANIFEYVPFLQKESHRLPQIIYEWKEYKRRVPTCGAIIISENMSHVLLVESHWEKVCWGFPKGKINEDEDPAHCAIREVLEETGLDISSSINPKDYLQSVINEQSVRLYIIRNIPLSTQFRPKTRCKIKSCKWFAISDLPTSKYDSVSEAKLGINTNAFFFVVPFVKHIKEICMTEHSNKHSVSFPEENYINNRPRLDVSKRQIQTTRNPSRTNRTTIITRERNCSKNKEVTAPRSLQHFGQTSNSTGPLPWRYRPAPQS